MSLRRGAAKCSWVIKYNVDVLFTCIPKLAEDFRCGEHFLAPTHPAGQEALPMVSLGPHHSAWLCLA